MNLNEAIIHAEKVALDKSSEMTERASGMLDVTDCKECMEQHLQLAEWLKELKQYQAIGTAEEIKEILQIISEGQDDVDERGVSTGLLHTLLEFAEYKKIGTIEECREARERQREKKPILCMNEQSGMFVDYADGHGEYETQMNNWWRCPCCNEVVGQRLIVHKHIHDQRKKNYCEKCGQAILWEGEKCQ